MNGEDLSPDHGAPLRIVAPGYLGARWVKWVDTIVISPTESPNFYQQRDYKILPPHVRCLLPIFFEIHYLQVDTKQAAHLLWSKYPAMTTLPLNSVVSTAYKSSIDTLFVKGYALPGPSGNVTAVEVSINDGQTWDKTNIIYQEGKFSWTIWEGNISCSAQSGTVYSRATDSSGHVQPKMGQWNLRGVAFNGWGKAGW